MARKTIDDLEVLLNNDSVVCVRYVDVRKLLTDRIKELKMLYNNTNIYEYKRMVREIIKELEMLVPSAKEASKC